MEFVKLKDAGMSADQAVGLTDDELCQIPEIAKQIKDGGKNSLTQPPVPPRPVQFRRTAQRI